MNFDNEEFYNLNKSLRSQVNYLVKDYSKLKEIIKSTEASSRRLPDNLGPLKTRVSSFNSIASSLLKTGAKTLAGSFSGSHKFDSSSVMNDIFGKFIGGMRASGGNVTAGTPYVVGERGAEIFTPTTSGNITPNNATGSRGGINITMNISTPDAGSFQRSEAQIMNQINRAMSKNPGR
jgi:hypothetical protein